MSDDATPRLELPYLAAAQAQKHVTVNEGLARLDALVQCAVISRTTAAEPVSPVDGALYILPGSPTGAHWSGHAAGTLMRFEAGAWQALEPPLGMLAYVTDAPALVANGGGGWADFASLIAALANLSMIGVNTTADTTNRLAVKSAAVLLDHDGAGVQLRLDKHAAGDTASLLFQTDYSGRAEIGLCGDDELHLKISTDGSSFVEALVVKPEGCIRLKSFTVAGLPTASSQGAGALAYVSDETGGAVLAFSDGSAWRRVTDRTVVS